MARVLGAATGGCAGAGSGRGAGTIGRSKVIAATAGTLRRRHHSSANSAASSADPPAIHGQYQPDEAAGSTSAGAAGVAGVTAKSVGSVETLGPIIVGSPGSAVAVGAGWAAGPNAPPCAVRAGWFKAGREAGVAAGRAALGAVGDDVWLALGLGAGLGVGVGVARGAAVVTTGLSRSTGPCDPGGAGFTVAPGKRQSLAACASSTAGASANPSAMALAAAFKLPPDLIMLWSILRE